MKKDIFFGLTDRELVQVTITEMRRRGLYGCIFTVPEGGGSSVFASSTPADTVTGLTVADQLRIFAKVADWAIAEKSSKIADDVTFDTEKKEWMN